MKMSKFNKENSLDNRVKKYISFSLLEIIYIISISTILAIISLAV